MVIGPKSGQMVAIPLSDPATSVIVHRHCTVQHENPRVNDEFRDSVEEMMLPQWTRQWEEENLDRLQAEAYDLTEDRLKRTCAGCQEEIEYMGDRLPEPPPAPPLPWGVTS